MTEQLKKEYEGILKDKLTEKRFFHSLCVADEAVRLAKKYNCDVEKAETAGLLHDIMKDAPEHEHLEILSEMQTTDLERGSKKLWHAMTGSRYIEAKLGITDADVISAVRYHTTARADMSLLEKIIYLADFTSADRDYEGVNELRTAVDLGLDAAMSAALQFSILDLAERMREIHPDTFEAYNKTMLKNS